MKSKNDTITGSTLSPSRLRGFGTSGAFCVMRLYLVLLLAMFLPIAGFTQPVAESFDLEITLMTIYNHDFTMQTTVRTDQPFVITATNGSITNTASGTLRAPTNGLYPLELTVSEWSSDKSNISDPTELNLELGKTWGGGPVSSFVFMRHGTLRKHESHLKAK